MLERKRRFIYRFSYIASVFNFSTYLFGSGTPRAAAGATRPSCSACQTLNLGQSSNKTAGKTFRRRDHRSAPYGKSGSIPLKKWQCGGSNSSRSGVAPATSQRNVLFFFYIIRLRSHQFKIKLLLFKNLHIKILKYSVLSALIFVPGQIDLAAYESLYPPGAP
ncbi:unnamed protein product, partial [Nesidiocoris tenuis]